MPSKQPSKKPVSKKPLPPQKPKHKPNVRAYLNQACEIANEIVLLCGETTKQGQLLDDVQIKNFKLATELLTKARQLTIQAKTSTVPTQQILIQASSSAVSDELRQLAAAVITNESKREKTK